MRNDHLVPDKVVSVVANREDLSPAEIMHVESCAYCYGWLIAFIELARHSNPNAASEIPPLKKPTAN
jgi:hypothetical protein